MNAPPHSANGDLVTTVVSLSDHTAAVIIVGAPVIAALIFCDLITAVVSLDSDLFTAVVSVDSAPTTVVVSYAAVWFTCCDFTSATIDLFGIDVT